MRNPLALNSKTVGRILLVAGIAAIASAPAWASAPTGTDGTALAQGLQKLVDLLTGTVARMLAILAVIGFGIGALTGRVDWIKALLVIMAIGVIFSAEWLVNLFRSGGAT